MKLGDVVLYRGFRYYLRGFDPMSVPHRLADLEDLMTGERATAPLDELAPDLPPPEAAGEAGASPPRETA